MSSTGAPWSRVPTASNLVPAGTRRSMASQSASSDHVSYFTATTVVVASVALMSISCFSRLSETSKRDWPELVSFGLAGGYTKCGSFSVARRWTSAIAVSDIDSQESTSGQRVIDLVCL